MSGLKEKIKIPFTFINNKLKNIKANKIINGKHKFSKKILALALTFIILYTIAVLIIDVKFGIQPNSNLTDNVYRFWGLEVSLLMVKAIVDTFKESSSNKIEDNSN